MANHNIKCMGLDKVVSMLCYVVVLYNTTGKKPSFYKLAVIIDIYLETVSSVDFRNNFTAFSIQSELDDGLPSINMAVKIHNPLIFLTSDLYSPPQRLVLCIQIIIVLRCVRSFRVSDKSWWAS